MSDRFHPLSMEQLTDWVFTELEQKGSLFNVPALGLLRPAPRPPLPAPRVRGGAGDAVRRGRRPAHPDGPEHHRGMARRRPPDRAQDRSRRSTSSTSTSPASTCQDEGYNVEWSQELKVHQSFDEYLRAWVLIHALHHTLGWPGERPGMVFNMSVGYNLEGMLRPNVQWYFDAMADASAYLPAYVEIVARHYPAVREIDIPARLSDTITLSTMHGCPPDEIERISLYLLEERGLHTSVKCNPTLLGAERVRGIVNDDLGFERRADPRRGVRARPEVGRRRPDVPQPAAGRRFARAGVRPEAVEHARGGELARSLRPGSDDVPVGPAAPRGHDEPGGHDRRGVPGRPAALVRRRRRLLQRGRPAGRRHAHGHGLLGPPQVGRLPAPAPVHRERGRRLRRRRRAGHDRLHPADGARRRVRGDGGSSPTGRGSTCAPTRTGSSATGATGRSSFRMDRSKTPRELGYFDCITAPCLDECPIDQQVPRYMAAVRPGTSGRPSASPASTIRCRRSSVASATTSARTPASAPTWTSRWRSARSSGSSWSRRCGRRRSRPVRDAGTARVASRDRGPGGDHRGGTGRPGGRRVACLRGLPRHDLRGAARTPAAWSAGRFPPTACRRRRSTRTSPSSSGSASRSATA